MFSATTEITEEILNAVRSASATAYSPDEAATIIFNVLEEQGVEPSMLTLEEWKQLLVHALRAYHHKDFPTPC